MSSKLVRFSPALKSVLAVVVLVVVVLALSWGAGQGTPASQAVVHSMSWLLWRVTASASVLLFLIVLLRGIAELRHEWNAGDTAQHAQIVVYVLLAVVFVTIGVGAVTQASGTAFSHMPRLPVTRLDVRAGVLVIVGAVAAIPWLAMVWLIHSASRDVRAEIEATAAAAVTPETSGESPLLPAFRRLAVLWEAIVRCALREAPMRSAWYQAPWRHSSPNWRCNRLEPGSHRFDRSRLATYLPQLPNAPIAEDQEVAVPSLCRCSWSRTSRSTEPVRPLGDSPPVNCGRNTDWSSPAMMERCSMPCGAYG
ncbi:hypothetical protein ACFWY5_16730 [Nonomuraea sp. NPDC059007]|uniref:hypothetical protein n=1 Tax=Nonomuraea sp. NPDC059007 TaxID=3346692 RepID=UPI003676571D